MRVTSIINVHVTDHKITAVGSYAKCTSHEPLTFVACNGTLDDRVSSCGVPPST